MDRYYTRVIPAGVDTGLALIHLPESAGIVVRVTMVMGGDGGLRGAVHGCCGGFGSVWTGG